MNVLLLGPQGAGKGTQAARIAAEYEIPHVATGDILREIKELETPLGREVKAVYERGDLVPDPLMVELIQERLAQEDAQRGFVLDGFPRTLPQAEALDEMLGRIGRLLTVVLALEVSDEVARERMRGRGRSDDTRDAIERRLSLYHEQTRPLLEHYRVRGGFVQIQGDRPEGDVFAQIQQALELAQTQEPVA